MRRSLIILFTGAVWLLAAAIPAAAVTCAPTDAAADTRAVRADPEQVIFRGVVDTVEAGVGRDAAATERPTTEGGVRGRRAVVDVTEVIRGDVPERVTIIGGSSEPNRYNTAERFFEPGVEYEFYPRNERSPFRDDLCTQSHVVGDEAADDHAHDYETTSTTTEPAATTATEPTTTPAADESATPAAEAPPDGGDGGGGAAVPLGAAALAGAAVWVARASDDGRRAGGAALVVVTVVATTLALAPTLVDAGHNAAGQGRHWGRAAGQGQATPGVRNQTGNANFTTPLQQAISTWNQTPHTDFVYILGGTASCNHENMTYNGVTTCLRSPLTCPPLTDAAGCAWVSLVAGTNHFARVVIYINPTHANSAGLRRSAFCHELGHALGLGHRGANNTTSCLRDTINTNNQAPDQHDFDQIFSQTNHTH